MIDGKSLLRGLQEILNEPSNSDFLNRRTSFDFIYMAAIEFTDRMGAIHKTTSISTVAGSQSYDLPADFLRLSTSDDDQKFYIRVSDGTTDKLAYLYTHNQLLFDNETVQKAFPDKFAIIDKQTIPSPISGVATANAASFGGKSRLTSSGSDFSTVNVGDIIHNITDGSSGIVVAVISTTELDVALFEGLNDDWTTDDDFYIQPQSNMVMVLNAPSSTNGLTMEITYVPRPNPVYCDYDIYRIPAHFMHNLVGYAAFLYKFKDRDANYGAQFLSFFERGTNQASKVYRNLRDKNRWGVNLMGNKRNAF